MASPDIAVAIDDVKTFVARATQRTVDRERKSGACAQSARQPQSDSELADH